jgi:hypothetical protein
VGQLRSVRLTWVGPWSMQGVLVDHQS